MPMACPAAGSGQGRGLQPPPPLKKFPLPAGQTGTLAHEAPRGGPAADIRDGLHGVGRGGLLEWPCCLCLSASAKRGPWARALGPCTWGLGPYARGPGPWAPGPGMAQLIRLAVAASQVNPENGLLSTDPASQVYRSWISMVMKALMIR